MPTVPQVGTRFKHSAIPPAGKLPSPTSTPTVGASRSGGNQSILPTVVLFKAGSEETLQIGWDMAETPGAAKCHLG